MTSGLMDKHIMNSFCLFVINILYIWKHQCAFYVGRILPGGLEFSDANGWVVLEVGIAFIIEPFCQCWVNICFVRKGGSNKM